MTTAMPESVIKYKKALDIYMYLFFHEMSCSVFLAYWINEAKKNSADYAKLSIY